MTNSSFGGGAAIMGVMVLLAGGCGAEEMGAGPAGPAVSVGAGAMDSTSASVGTGGAGGMGGMGGMGGSVGPGPEPPAKGLYLDSEIFDAVGSQVAWDASSHPQHGVAVVGSFTDTVNFGSDVLTSQGVVNGFLLMLDAESKPKWATSFGGSGIIKSKAVAIRSDGHVVVGGLYTGAPTFGQVQLPDAGMATNCQAAGVFESECVNAFIAMLDPMGGHMWAIGFGAPDGGQHIKDIAIDPMDGLIGVVGFSTGDFSLVGDNEQTIDIKLTSGAIQDPFVAMLDPMGGHVDWARGLGLTKFAAFDALEFDSLGHVLVGGFRGEPGTIDGFPLNGKNRALFLAFNVNSKPPAVAGEVAWVAPDWPLAAVNEIVLSPTKQLHVGGAFFDLPSESTVNFGTGELSSPDGVEHNYFLATFGGADKMDLTKAIRAQAFSAKRDNQLLSTQAVKLSLDPWNNVLMSVVMHGSPTNFGAGALPHVGGLDVAIAKFAGDGTLYWAKGFGAAGDDFLAGVMPNFLGQSTVVGTVNGIIDFGGGPLSSVADDVFVARFTP